MTGGKAINLRNLQRMYDLNGPRWTVKHLRESLKTKALAAEDFSIRDLYTALVPDGKRRMRVMERRGRSGLHLLEANTAVDTSAFSNITGQIVFNKILEGYENPEFLYPKLLEKIPTTFLDRERFASIGAIGDMAERIGEGQMYPNVGVNEVYVDTPSTEKYGNIVPVTREMVIADRTGQLLKYAGDVGHALGINLEKRALDVVVGAQNSYTRNGTSTNTYLTSGAYTNQQANALVDHTDQENAELLLARITDPSTGEPILNKPKAFLVPQALYKTAQRIVNATGVAVVDLSASTNTQRMYTKPPELLYPGGQLQVLTNAWVHTRTGDHTTWFLGDFQNAFGHRIVWDIEVLQAATNSEAEFTQDVMLRYRSSMRGVVVIKDPRFVCKNTAA